MSQATKIGGMVAAKFLITKGYAVDTCVGLISSSVTVDESRKNDSKSASKQIEKFSKR